MISVVFDLAWTTEGIEWLEKSLKTNPLHGNDLHIVQRMQRLLRKYIFPKDKHILVIGSTRPWIEAILLAEGARNITTLEYNPYPTNHPRILTISPYEFSKLVVRNNVPLFDAVVTFSSLEHSGLGR